MGSREGLRMDYGSPRWSAEIADCSMPMSFDTYSKCAYNCLYCFSYFQKIHTLDGYKKGELPRCANPEKVKKLFEKAIKGDTEGISKNYIQFFPYIQDRKIMQWGGLADEFDEWERRFGVTLELLEFFDSIDYPLSFSTKAAWWTLDERYMGLFRRHTHNWHVKISIITADEEKARKMEKGCPSPEERLEAIKRLSEAGVHVTLRLRPFVIGLSGDWRRLIKRAAEAGADSVTTEFFCLECRADERLKKRYAEMSEICGFDVFRFYMKNSSQSGYKRLNRGIKAPIIHEMRDFTHLLGLKFYVSDTYCRECSDGCNCCGVPPEWGYSQMGNIGNAILIARENGEVRFSDISGDIKRYFGGFKWENAASYNTGSNKLRATWYGKTMYEFLRTNWNSVERQTGPAVGYGGILRPIGRDENGDVIYGYALEREGSDGKEA